MDREFVATDPGDPAGLSLTRDPWGRLVLVDAGGRRHVGVEPVRVFPLSDPGHAISLVDAEGREVAFLDDLDELPAPSRQVLAEELAQREFMPIIRRIVAVSTDSAPSDWTVETDRGPTRFTLNADEDVRRLGPTRALMIDPQGIRYLIPDTRALDAHSRRILERFL